MNGFWSYRYHKSMPLLDWCNEYFDINLENYFLISCHHILESNLFMLHYLFEKNLKPENVICLWKCYSTNQEIFDFYKHEKIKIDKNSLFFDPKISFQEQYSRNIEMFLNKIFKTNDLSSFEKIIVRDDGWELLYQINKRITDGTNVVWIEHTSNWFHKLRKTKIQFPIINIARSEAKLLEESPFIAKLAVKNFHTFIEKHNLFIKNVLIIWGWAIGHSLKKELAWKYHIDIYDIDQEKSTISWTIEEIINNYDVVFWATGNNVLSYATFKKLKTWILLVSVSSWDYEFCSLDIRKRTNNFWIWDDLQLDGKWLLNWWFPITFTWEKEAVPLEEIQLTRGLIYWAIYQTSTIDSHLKWFIHFDNDIQKKIVTKFKEIYHKKSLKKMI